MRAGVKAYTLILQGQFIGVVGRVGSGKSSLLAAITAEMNITQGEVCVFVCVRACTYVYACRPACVLECAHMYR